MTTPPATGVTAEQIASLSHEFRTPLNGVLGMARLLDGTRLTAEQRSYVQALKDSGDHLLTLVNDFLDLARLGSGQIQLHPGRVEVEDLLRRVCELLSPRAHEKGIEIAWAAAPGLAPILADEGRLRQILINFAGNAIKFTDAGGVLITADTRDEQLRFTVSDTGPGVPPADRERIFQPFVQSEAGARVGGAGLGLAIVTSLAERMGGAVGVEGERGADFWFEAPFPAAGPAVADRSLMGQTVAIASTNAVVREAAARQVAACGGRPAGAQSPEQAARLAPGAVLLVDPALAPGKRLPKPPPGAPALILLKPEERGRIARARALGYAGYLIKPLRRESLSARVLVASGHAAPPGPAANLEDDRVAVAAAPGARVLLAEDNPINAMLARALLEREGCTVVRAANGEEALDLAASGVFDIILMDVRMPKLSGLEAARALRARGVRTPIVALTADAFEDDRQACLAAGMDDFLVKPLTLVALRAALTRHAGPRWTEPPRDAKLAS
ncbi:MAG: hybrid sensor histidine kinase/response regulator [Caulobacter sp.]|nr:hybrid sensor histidine kinase/response regulator [Caulobacter sp.]